MIRGFPRVHTTTLLRLTVNRNTTDGCFGRFFDRQFGLSSTIPVCYNKSTAVDDFDAFKEVLASKGGFVAAHWDGTAETELAIKEATKATIRCIPIDGKTEQGSCVYSGKPSNQRVLFAKAY